jgi:PAS domain S-box-containing protein
MTDKNIATESRSNEAPFRLLFVSAGTAGPAAAAAAWMTRTGLANLDVTCAGWETAGIPEAFQAALSEAGLSLPGHTFTLTDLPGQGFDLVVQIEGQEGGQRPFLPGDPETLRWALGAWSANAETVSVAESRAICEELHARVIEFIEHGYLNAFQVLRRKYTGVLDNITEGLLAHDLDQRIFYLNAAAERITGYSRNEVLNRKCGDIFPGGLCGGKCLFEEGVPALDRPICERAVDIVTRTGERRHTMTQITPIYDPAGQPRGVVMALRDITREKTLSRRSGETESFCGIIGKSPQMLALFELIRDLADSPAPVLIQGDSGTGKELVARAIHSEGRRRNKLFVPVNCGALPEGLLESELFGHVRGAFTGAIRDKKGRFELADGGTIFLDEIGDISLAMQVKLLRVLQEGHFERVGSEQTLKVNVRVISATNKDLKQEILQKRFREDLFYRLSVMPIQLPRLIERRMDIPAIATHILEEAVREAERPPVMLSPASLDVLMTYQWPGNIREMENWLQYALLKCKGRVIEPEHFPPPAIWANPAQPPVALGDAGSPPALHRTRARVDAETLRGALARTGGNRVAAARLLGISRATLYRSMQQLGLK